MKHAKQYFDNHNTVGQLYFTSDHLAFFDEQHALNHAKHLADKNVSVKTRAEVDAAASDLVSDGWEDDLFEEFDED